MKDSGTAICNAAAQVREMLIARAARRLGVAAERLHGAGRRRRADDGRRVGYRRAGRGRSAARARADGQSKLRDPAAHRCIGKSVPRVDIPAKVTGGAAYVQDLRLPDMVHARVVRPPSYGARLRDARDRRGREDARACSRSCATAASSPSSPSASSRRCSAMRALGAPRALGRDARRLPDQGELLRNLQRLPADDHRGSRRARDRQRADARSVEGELSPALPDARLDRTVLRGRRCSRTAR